MGELSSALLPCACAAALALPATIPALGTSAAPRYLPSASTSPCRFNASWWVWTRFEDVSGWDVEEAVMKASAGQLAAAKHPRASCMAMPLCLCHGGSLRCAPRHA